MNSFKIMAIIRASILCAVVAMAVGCADKEFDAQLNPKPTIPDNGIHKIPPKKTITIKRKKPTIGNPSPRPLTAEMPCEEMYEEYAEYEEYEGVNEE